MKEIIEKVLHDVNGTSCFVFADNDLSKLLSENKKKPEKNWDEWLEKCRAAMLATLSSKPELSKGNSE